MNAQAGINNGRPRHVEPVADGPAATPDDTPPATTPRPDASVPALNHAAVRRRPWVDAAISLGCVGLLGMVVPLFAGCPQLVLTPLGPSLRPLLEPVGFYNGIGPAMSAARVTYTAGLLLAAVGLVVVAAFRPAVRRRARWTAAVLALAGVASVGMRLTLNPRLFSRPVPGFTGHLCVIGDDLVMSTTGPGILRWTDAPDGKLYTFAPTGASAIVLAGSARSGRVLVRDGDRRLRLYSTRDGELIATIRTDPATIGGAAFCDDGSRFAVLINASYVPDRDQWITPAGGNLRIYASGDGHLVRSVATPPLSGHFRCISWRADTLAAAEAWDQRHGRRGVLVVDTRRWQVLGVWAHAKYPDGPLSTAVSPDGRTVAVGYAPSDVVLWDVATGRPRAELVSHGNWVVCLDFSPDGRLLASGEGDSAVRVWDTRTGAQLQHFGMGSEAASNYTLSLAFGPRGRRLYCGTENGYVIGWRVGGR